VFDAGAFGFLGAERPVGSEYSSLSFDLSPLSTTDPPPAPDSLDLPPLGPSSHLSEHANPSYLQRPFYLVDPRQSIFSLFPHGATMPELLNYFQGVPKLRLLE
jgi:hypothetical protein